MMNNHQENGYHHEEENSRKRKHSYGEDDENDLLTLTLFPTSTIAPTVYPHAPPLAPPPCLPPPPLIGAVGPTIPFYSGQFHSGPYRQQQSGSVPSSRQRRNRPQPQREDRSETIPPPYPWATDRRATVRNLTDLKSNQINRITGQVQCKRCEKRYEMEFDLQEKFDLVGGYLAENKDSLCDRAPGKWMNPVLPTCRFCQQENSVKPIISGEKKSINWLFLFLGEMIGLCNLNQLKHFCKYTKNHRTAAKNRLVYLTYLTLCKQLDPDGPFDR